MPNRLPKSDSIENASCSMTQHCLPESPKRLFFTTIALLIMLSLLCAGLSPWVWTQPQLGPDATETQRYRQSTPSDSSKPDSRASNDSLRSKAMKNENEQLVLVRHDHGPNRTDLDFETLQRSFAKLKQTVILHSGKYRGRLDQMMVSYLPAVSTEQWMPHSPSGKKFTVKEIHTVAKSTVKPGFLVPNIAHFVLPFGDTSLQFHHMVSLLSCLHVMKPHRLLLWYAPGKQPTGQWWERVRRNLTETDFEEKVIMVQRPVPTSVYTVPVHGKEHQSDVVRLEAVLVFGGVYMDIDVFVLKPLEPLRKFPCTIGREVPYGLCNGIFMSAPNGTFLAMWHTAYQVFNDEAWGDHSVKLPSTMQAAFPDLCHVEEESMDRPNWTPEEVDWIYGIGKQRKWDWRKKNYAMHLWFRMYGKQHNMDNIKTLDSNYGEMCRYILFGVY